MIYGKEIMTNNLIQAKLKLLSVLSLNRIELADETKSLCILEFQELKELTSIKAKRKTLFSDSNIHLLFANQYQNLSIDVIVYNKDVFKPDSKTKVNNEDMMILLIKLLITYQVKNNGNLDLDNIENVNKVNELAICIAESQPRESFKEVYNRLSSKYYKFTYIDENSINILR